MWINSGYLPNLRVFNGEAVCFLRGRKWNCVYEIRKRKANWIGHILRRNCLLQQVIEGKIKGQIEVTRRQGRRRKKLLDDLKDRRGYCQFKEEALDRIMWRNRFGRGFGPVVWQITGDDDDDDNVEWRIVIHTTLYFLNEKLKNKTYKYFLHNDWQIFLIT